MYSVYIYTRISNHIQKIMCKHKHRYSPRTYLHIYHICIMSRLISTYLILPEHQICSASRRAFFWAARISLVLFVWPRHDTGSGNFICSTEPIKEHSVSNGLGFDKTSEASRNWWFGVWSLGCPPFQIYIYIHIPTEPFTFFFWVEDVKPGFFRNRPKNLCFLKYLVFVKLSCSGIII